MNLHEFILLISMNHKRKNSELKINSINYKCIESITFINTNTDFKYVHIQIPF